MAKIPYMKFYCQDWLKDSQLRLCSAATRGVFIDMLAMMHDFDKRGYLVISEKANGKLIESKLKAKQIARMIGEDLTEVETAIDELIRYNVLKIDDSGCLYNKRMVAETELSNARSASGKQGGRGKKKDVVKSKPKAKEKQNPEYEYEYENVNENVNEIESSKISADKFEIPDYLNTPDFIRGVSMWAEANLQKNDRPLADLEIQAAIKAIAKYAKGDIKRAYAMIASNHETVYRKMYEPKTAPTPTSIAHKPQQETIKLSQPKQKAQ